MKLPVSVLLMIVLVAVFAIQCINDVYLESTIERRLALTSESLTRGYVWQFLTFQFLHGSILHLAGNLLGLWFFGRFVESVIGRQRFLVAYFGCGVIGGILQSVLMTLFPYHYGGFVYGASAGVFGIFAIFARLMPDSEVRWNFILPIRTDVMLWIAGGIELFFTVVPSGRGGGVAHAAHLGGILAGLAFVRLGWHQDFRPLPGSEFLARLRRQPTRSTVSRQLVKASSPKKSFWQKESARPVEEVPSAEFISREVDPILDKISAHGIQSLTERERKILEAARARMARR